MKKGTTATFSLMLTIALATFTGSALAGNGNGNGSATSQATPAGTASPAPGNSANAPGQQKKDAATSTSTATADTVQGSAAQNSTAQPGMKPTNKTNKQTSCTTGGSAGSVTCTPDSADTAAAGHADASKKYGNGTTAAQVATTNGAPAGTTIRGPGNSQPHKATCPNTAPKNPGDGIDVHALKSGKTLVCTTSVPTATQTTVQTVTPTMTQVFGSTSIQTATPAGAVAGTSTSVPTSTPAGVLGTNAGGKANGKPFGGVLGALTTVGHGALPFTGFPLWIVFAIGAALLVAGLGLTRHARHTV